MLPFRCVWYETLVLVTSAPHSLTETRMIKVTSTAKQVWRTVNIESWLFKNYLSICLYIIGDTAH